MQGLNFIRMNQETMTEAMDFYFKQKLKLNVDVNSVIPDDEAGMDDYFVVSVSGIVNEDNKQ